MSQCASLFNKHEINHTAVLNISLTGKNPAYIIPENIDTYLNKLKERISKTTIFNTNLSEDEDKYISSVNDMIDYIQQYILLRASIKLESDLTKELNKEEGTESGIVIQTILDLLKIEKKTLMSRLKQTDDAGNNIGVQNVVQQYIQKLQETKSFKDVLKQIKVAVNQVMGLEELNLELTTDQINQNLAPIFNQEENKQLLEPVTEFQRNALTLPDLVEEIFKNQLVINSYRVTEFRQKLFQSTLKNGNKIIDSVKTLNESIQQLLESEYSAIYKFLKEKGLAEGLSQSLYRTTNGQKTRVTTVYKTLNTFYNYIHQKAKEGVLDSQLYDSWSDHILNNKAENDALYLAINAYINLTNIDEIIASTVGDYISINENLQDPIIKVSTEAGEQIYYKYSFNNGNKNNVKTFSENIQDALSLMGNHAKLVIQSIAKYDYQTKQKQFGYLTYQDFTIATSQLMHVLRTISYSAKGGAEEKIQNAINKFSEDPTQHFKTILEQLFKNTNNIGIMKQLKSNKVDDRILNILYSIYREVYANPDSFYNVEQQYITDNGLLPVYSLTDTIANCVNSNVAIKYLQSVFNYNTDVMRMTTSVKSRLFSQSALFDTVAQINDNNISRALNNTMSYDYDIELNKSEEIKVNIDGYIIYVVPENNLSSGVHKNNLLYVNSKLKIQDRNGKDINFNELIASLSEQDFASFVKNEPLTDPKAQEFKKLLTFIENMLGLNFTSDMQSMNKLNMLIKYNENNFKSMLTSAIRALAITKIYSTKPKGTNVLDYISEKINNNEAVYYFDIKNLQSDQYLRPYLFDYNSRKELVTVGFGEQWIADLTEVNAIISGNTVITQIKDLQGNSQPNSTLTFLAETVKEQFQDAIEDKDGASNELLFSDLTASEAIINVAVNLDVSSANGDKKLIKKMNQSELFHDQLITKFIIPILDKTVWIQPAVYADKTKYPTFQIRYQNLPINVNFDEILNIDAIVESIKKTIGGFYNKQFKQIISDYRTIFDYTNNITDEEIINTLLPQKFEKYSKFKIIKLAEEKGVKLVEELHYRVSSKKSARGHKLLVLNETVKYLSDLYNDTNRIKTMLRNACIDYVNGLIENLAHLSVKQTFISNKQVLDTKDPLTNYFNKLKLDQNLWLRGNRLVLAVIRDSNGDIIDKIVNKKISLKPGQTIEFNPIISNYVYGHNLLSENIRLGIVGSEAVHPIKKLTDATFLIKTKDNEILTIDGYYNAMQKISELKDDPKAKAQLQQQLDARILKCINSEQITQSKRNVPVSATMIKHNMNNIKGQPQNMIVAVREDTKVKVFNSNGDSGTVDAHDGMAYTSPIFSKLCNETLQGNEVGTVKKTLLHDYDTRTGHTTLLKFAEDTITNARMMLSEGSTTKWFDMFKKMHNISWNGEIDLINGCAFKNNSKIDFLNNICEGKPIYYTPTMFNGKLLAEGFAIEISDFGRTNGVYYTKETRVSSPKASSGQTITIYHYFTEDSKHVPSTQLLTKEEMQAQGLHTIDSLFELHTAMGSFNTVTFENSNWIPSEKSIDVVTNFTNYVSNLTEKGRNLEQRETDIPITQEYYDQPLKRAMIHMLANKTAMKEGYANINPADCVNSSEPLTTMSVSTRQYGPQQDSDHEADEAEITEFSQVISALSANGVTQERATEIYQALGEVALESAGIEISALEDFISSGDYSKLYDIVGRILIENIRFNKGGMKLTENIIKQIKQQFNINSDHALDKIFLPFSDHTIYNQVLSIIISSINRKSIKRKFPGMGTVMVAGYDMAMYYDIDGKPYLFKDVLKIAKSKLSQETISRLASITKDNSELNRLIVSEYLAIRQQAEPKLLASEFNPTDNILVTLESNDISTQISISLNDIQDYYNFTENYEKFLAKLGYAGYTVKSIQKDVTKPRNLAPQQVSFIANGSKVNIYQHWRIKGLMLALNRLSKSDLSSDEKTILESKIRKIFSPTIAYIQLSNHEYATIDNLEDVINNALQGIDITNNINETIHNVSKIEDKPAELIVSNIYQSAFNLSRDQSIVDIAANESFRPQFKVINNDTYDMVFTANKKSTYITFNKTISNPHVAISSKKMNIIPIKENSKNLLYRIDSDNNKLYIVGQEVPVTDVEYRDGQFVNKDGTVAEGVYRFDSDHTTILKQVMFVQLLKATDYTNNQQKTYNLVQILKDNIESIYGDETNEFIGNLLGDIYHSEDHCGVMFNNKMLSSNFNIVKNVLPTLRKSISENESLYKYLKTIITKFDTVDTSNERVKFIYLKELNQYKTNLAKQIRSSWEISRYMTAARIPSQTLQSFMKMYVVGYTGSNKNECFVSHWQTWLQGSDYKH